jgi:REP element-mobilizing transposase RayT
MRARTLAQLTFEERRKFTKAGKPKKRPGPKPAERARIRHRVRPTHKHWVPMHVTLRAAPGLPSFREQVLYPAFERAVRATVREDFRIVEFSVQDNHVHLIVEAKDNDALARGMKSFTVRANRLFNAAARRGRGRVWGDRYHRRDLTSPRQVRNAIVYCLQNYKKHQNVPAGRLVIDPCSSARWFSGWSIPRTQQTNDGPSPAARPKTFLLGNLWKRHGLINPGERPNAPG